MDNNAKILVVDDNKLNRIFLADVLRKEGYNILEADDGYSGFKVAYDEKPDLILLDVIMPGNDGINVCRMLKKEEVTCNIPIIFVTARSEKDDIIKGFEAGAVDYVTKPVFVQELLVRVKTHLKLKIFADELKKKNEELEELNSLLSNIARKDALMDIWNRGAFDIELQRLHKFATRYKRIYSLILADIDYFKLYNDCYGHIAGDDVLREVANIFKDACRTTDFIARYGGEEIVVILPETTALKAVVLAERIMDKLAARNIVHEMNPITKRLSISIGIAKFNPENAIAYQDVIKMADTALYQAKNTGRNKVFVYETQDLVLEKQKSP
ncbi:MAG: diguanylate cyclase [Bacillota bacterium]